MKVNGNVATKAGQKVRRGDLIEVTRDVVAKSEAGGVGRQLVANPNVKIDVLWEDECVVVVNKAKGVVVHPSPENGRNYDDSLCSGLLSRYGKEGLAKGDGERPGVVHRLDCDTSGALAVAKTEEGLVDLQRQLKEGEKTMKRTYVALVAGGWGQGKKEGTVDAPLGRHPKQGTKRCVVEESKGKRAITHYKVLKEFCNGSVALVECNLETGRTHQIRVHMKHIHHPLLCDPLYGTGSMPCAKYEPSLAQILKKHGVEGQYLHAKTLSFDHPVKGKPRVVVEAPLPPYWQEALNFLESQK